MDRTTLELMALTALSALAGGVGFLMGYIAVGYTFAAITLSLMIISRMVSRAD